MGGKVPEIIGTSSDPGADTEHSFTLGNEGPYVLKSLSFALAAVSGTGRLVEILFAYGGSVFHRVVTTATILAGNTGNIIAASGILDGATGTNYRYCKLPDFFVVPSGTVITTIRSDDQSGDNYTPIVAFGYERYLRAK